MVLIDLSKAFDSICHRTLLTKLKGLGASIEALNWFESYLKNRMQSTRLGTSRSIELTVTHGVPQGSILGPLLFSLYMNDLPSVVKFSRVESYVDDTKVYLSCSSENINSCLAKVSEYLRLIASWCCTNKLLINPDKTKLILFGTKLLLSKVVVKHACWGRSQSERRKKSRDGLSTNQKAGFGGVVKQDGGTKRGCCDWPSVGHVRYQIRQEPMRMDCTGYKSEFRSVF